MELWIEKSIKELGAVVTGKTPSKAQPEYYENGDQLFVSPKDLDWNQFYVADTETRITEKALEKHKNQVLPRNAVLFTSLSFAFGKMGITSQPCLTNQQINSVIVNDEHDYRFVYYLLQQYRPIIFSYNSGIDTPIVPKSVFESILVKCPGLETQKKIAAILSAYDDLIENNKRRIAILEKMAEEIYREWFVRFRFPGYQDAEFEKGIPKGWQNVPLSELGSYLNGFAFKPEHWGSEGIPIIKIKEMTSGVTLDTPRNFGTDIDPKYHFSNGEIIFSWSATLLVTIWNQGPGLLNQHLFKVTPKQALPRDFLFYALKFSLPIFESLTTGSTMKHIKRKELSMVKIPLAPPQILKKFNSIVHPLVEEVLLLSSQIKILDETKNMLLPRLISGKLSVEDLDIEFPPSMQEAV